jgi:aspartate ammonia-lyase
LIKYYNQNLPNRFLKPVSLALVLILYFCSMTKDKFRIEKDFIGEMNIPKDVLYGIHSVRARKNFPDNTAFHLEWYKALGSVKRACYITAKEFFEKALDRASVDKINIKIVASETFNFLIKSAEDIEKGAFFSEFITPAISGGAGTSINMNVNEIIANHTLQLMGHKPGEYQFIDPIEHANIFQSTNDVIPTSLKIAVIKLLQELEESINNLRQVTEQLERKHQYHVRKAYTQMQEAVPSSYGRLFSTYNEALSRDWWRISKCFERLKVVNLGGSAIGSGITTPRYFIMEVVRKLQELTGLPVTRGENLYDATSNLDALVEVHGMLKAMAVNLEKMSSDMRLLSSDVFGSREIEIPQKQVGSSIMPGKVNPVIPEFVISCSHKVYANDLLITTLSAQGCLELNAYIPTIGHSILESIRLLIASANSLNQNLFTGLIVNEQLALENLLKSPAITTAIVPYVGYNKAAEVSRHLKDSCKNIFELNDELKFMNSKQLKDILKPENLLKEGFSLKDITGQTLG